MPAAKLGAAAGPITVADRQTVDVAASHVPTFRPLHFDFETTALLDIAVSRGQAPVALPVAALWIWRAGGQSAG